MAKGDIHRIAVSLQNYVGNMGANIDQALYTVEQDLTDLNREQMLSNKGYDNKPLVNIRTGNEKLSKQYAKKTGKTYPDIFVNGNYQDEMRTITNYNSNAYRIFSYHSLSKYLTKQYLNLHGIPVNMISKAQKISNKAIGVDIKNKCFKK